MHLRVSVLAGLGGGHVDDLARAACSAIRTSVTNSFLPASENRTLDNDVPVLTKGRALHGEGERSTRSHLDCRKRSQDLCGIDAGANRLRTCSNV